MERDLRSEKIFRDDFQRLLKMIYSQLAISRNIKELNKKTNVLKATVNEKIEIMVSDMVKKQNRKVKSDFQKRYKDTKDLKYSLVKVKENTIKEVQLYIDKVHSEIEQMIKAREKEKLKNLLLLLLLLFSFKRKSDIEKDYYRMKVSGKSEEEIFNDLTIKYSYEQYEKRNKVAPDGIVGETHSNIVNEVARKLNIKIYVWLTEGDRKVRKSHKMMEGVVCEYSQDPIPGFYEEPSNSRSVAPGEDYNCRCHKGIIKTIGDLKDIAKNGKIKYWDYSAKRVRTMSLRNAIQKYIKRGEK